MSDDATEDGGAEQDESMLPYEDRLKEITDEIRERDQLGEVAYWGDIGFHTFYNPSRADHVVGTMTALHIAFEETVEELWLDPDIVEDNHGEVTPETVAHETELQIEDFIGRRRFVDRFVENVESVLSEFEEHHAEHSLPDGQQTLDGGDSDAE